MNALWLWLDEWCAIASAYGVQAATQAMTNGWGG